MMYIGVGNIVAINADYYSEPYHIPKGTKFEITFVDRQGIPYHCRCLTMPVSLWLRRDQIDIVKQ